ncbi:cytochrome b [Wolbachia endosymbiont of Ctenocephalides felis wCfeJ]|uniref:cytochrome b n=1 Tax=Wolbachia endosymbiont of Ctenocephalides felis wCfeJ TaxID=2732594 RepID=UPI001445B218|nr:cytochrome b [Wolbachia endosymbiont of Ctenocephalides felis wCfeJ]WCR58046.1 MAG: Cytochrome b561 [Wolbachia endosymbiont of Ctenocephalides felis wCfeJ]
MESNKYSLGLRIIHWVMAVFIIGMLCSGFYMKSLPMSSEIKFNIYAIHKAFGVTILGLIIVRIFFRVFTYVPSLPATLSRFEINASKTVHFGLYALMILMPLSGYIMSSASGREIKYLFHIPLLISRNKEVANIANGTHSMLAYFMVFFIVLHILAALKHTFIDKQNIFKRII